MLLEEFRTPFASWRGESAPVGVPVRWVVKRGRGVTAFTTIATPASHDERRCPRQKCEKPTGETGRLS